MSTLQTTFAALSDPTRRAIVARLAEGEATVSQLVDLFDLSQPTVSAHLKVLERARLITRGRDAQRRPCRLDPAGLKTMADWLKDYERFWTGTLDRFVEHGRQDTKGRCMTASTELKLERHVPLSPRDCFALWTDADALKAWWGPKDEHGRAFEAHFVQWPAQSGAPWRIGMTAPDGTVFWQEGEMLEIDPPRQLRFSFSWSDDGGRGPATEITVRFVPEGAGTRLVFVQSGFSDAPTRDGHGAGWAECLDRLVAGAERDGGRSR